MKYEMIIYWSDTDNAYLVEVPDTQVVWRMVQRIKTRFKMLNKLLATG
jgi:predicted RNase H-like HicB family nuclease